MTNDPRFDAYLAALSAAAGAHPPLAAEENRVTLTVGPRGVQLIYDPADDVVSYLAALSADTPTPTPRQIAGFNVHYLFNGGYVLLALPTGALIFAQRRPRLLIAPDALVDELGYFRQRSDMAEEWCRNPAG